MHVCVYTPRKRARQAWVPEMRGDPEALERHFFLGGLSKVPSKGL